MISQEAAQIGVQAVGNDHVLDPFGLAAFYQRGQSVLLAELLHLFGVQIPGQLFDGDVILAFVELVEAFHLGQEEDCAYVFAGLIMGDGEFHDAFRGSDGADHAAQHHGSQYQRQDANDVFHIPILLSVRKGASLCPFVLWP